MNYPKLFCLISIAVLGLNLPAGAGPLTFDVFRSPISDIANYAFDVNNKGQVVGSYHDAFGAADPRNHMFIYDHGTFTAVPDVPGSNDNSPFHMNDVGQFVGLTFNGPTNGFVYSGGISSVIGMLNATTATYGINDLGQIVGMASLSDGGTKAFLYSGGQFTDIDLPGSTYTTPYGINNAGDVVGQSSFGGFLYSGGVFSNFIYPSALSTNPLDINNFGDVVGSYVDSNHLSHAFLFAGGVFSTIDPPAGYDHITVVGLNDRGQMAGYLWNQNLIDSYAFVATPSESTKVPEPASGSILLLGLGGIAWIVRRRARANGLNQRPI